MLAFIGFMVTISLASAANIHIELNRLEEKLNAKIFTETRKKLKASVRLMLFLLICSLTLVTVKPVLPSDYPSPAICNSLALLLCLAYAQVLYDLTMAAFSLPSIVTPSHDDEGSDE